MEVGTLKSNFKNKNRDKKSMSVKDGFGENGGNGGGRNGGGE